MEDQGTAVPGDGPRIDDLSDKAAALTFVVESQETLPASRQLLLGSAGQNADMATQRMLAECEQLT